MLVAATERIKGGLKVPNLNLNVTPISDIYVRQAFTAIQNFINSISAIEDLTFISTEITNQDSKITHNLGFVPVDLIQTRFENPNVTINWLYEKFDNKYLYFTVENLPATQDNTKYGLNILVGRLGL